MKNAKIKNTVMPDVVFKNFNEWAIYIHEQTKLQTKWK